MALGIIKKDPYLAPFEKDLLLRLDSYKKKRAELVSDSSALSDFANGYEYFGIHPTDSGWVYREWAPGADEMYFTGDFADWDCKAYPMTRIENGVFEIYLDGKETLTVGQKVQCIVIKNGEFMRRVPAYATRVVQDPVTYNFCAEVDDILFHRLHCFEKIPQIFCCDDIEWIAVGIVVCATSFVEYVFYTTHIYVG